MPSSAGSSGGGTGSVSGSSALGTTSVRRSPGSARPSQVEFGAAVGSSRPVQTSTRDSCQSPAHRLGEGAQQVVDRAAAAGDSRRSRRAARPGSGAPRASPRGSGARPGGRRGPHRRRRRPPPPRQGPTTRRSAPAGSRPSRSSSVTRPSRIAAPTAATDAAATSTPVLDRRACALHPAASPASTATVANAPTEPGRAWHRGTDAAPSTPTATATSSRRRTGRAGRGGRAGRSRRSWPDPTAAVIPGVGRRCGVRARQGVHPHGPDRAPAPPLRPSSDRRPRRPRRHHAAPSRIRTTVPHRGDLAAVGDHEDGLARGVHGGGTGRAPRPRPPSPARPWLVGEQQRRRFASARAIATRWRCRPTARRAAPPRGSSRPSMSSRSRARAVASAAARRRSARPAPRSPGPTGARSGGRTGTPGRRGGGAAGRAWCC
jgi:hypothetical protein